MRWNSKVRNTNTRIHLRAYNYILLNIWRRKEKKRNMNTYIIGKCSVWFWFNLFCVIAIFNSSSCLSIRVNMINAHLKVHSRLIIMHGHLAFFLFVHFTFSNLTEYKYTDLYKKQTLKMPIAYYRFKSKSIRALTSNWNGLTLFVRGRRRRRRRCYRWRRKWTSIDKMNL